MSAEWSPWKPAALTDGPSLCASTVNVPRAARRLDSRIRRLRLATHHARLTTHLTGLFAVVLSLAGASRADHVVLRNTDRLNNIHVQQLDENGVLLEGGRRVGWDEIESGVVAGRQAEFDELLAAVGDHLYRIRRRLELGESSGLLEHAEAVFPRYKASQGETAAMVFQALLWGRLAADRRETALEAYLHCVAALGAPDSRRWKLPGGRTLRYDRATGLCEDLLPVWFDEEQARGVLPAVNEILATKFTGPPAGLLAYQATLALSAGDTQAADDALERMQALVGKSGVLLDLATLVQLQRELTRREADGPAAWAMRLDVGRLDPQLQSLGYYWKGRAVLASNDPQRLREGVVTLLYVPALSAETRPELSAAALFHAAAGLDELADKRSASRLRRELLDAYPRTHFARILNARPGEPVP